MGIMLKLEILKEKILRKMAEKKAERQAIKNIKSQAKIEAMEEMKPQLKEKIKQDMVDKLSGKAKEEKKEKFKKFFGTLAKEFKESNIGSKESVDRMLGRDVGGRDIGVGSGIPDRILGNSSSNSALPSGDRIASLMGRRQEPQEPQEYRYYEQQEYRQPQRRPQRKKPVKQEKRAPVKRQAIRPQPHVETQQEKLARLMGGNNGSDSRERIMRALGKK